MSPWPYRYKIPLHKGTFSTAQSAVRALAFLGRPQRAVSVRFAGIEIRVQHRGRHFEIIDRINRPPVTLARWPNRNPSWGSWLDALKFARQILRRRAA